MKTIFSNLVLTDGLFCVALPLLTGCSDSDAEFRAKLDALAIKREMRKQEKIEQLHQIAEQGDTESQYQLGMHYVEISNPPWGTDQDRAEAVKWLRKAAEQGHVDAQYRLAMCYNRIMRWQGDGSFIPANPKETVE